MRAAIYARFSTDLQNPKSADDQAADCVRRCEEEQWEVVKIYKDEALTGQVFYGRPGLQELLADAAIKKFDIVVAEAIDRFSRNLGRMCDIYQTLAHYGVRV